MTRIRSPRELRIVVAQTPPAADTAGARFGQLFGQARQALSEPDRGVQPRDGERDDEAGEQQHSHTGDEGAPEAALAEPAAAGPGATLARTMPPPPRLPGLGGTRAPLHKAATRRPGRNADSAAAETARALGAPLIRHCARATEGELVTDHLAERIASFCASPALERAGGRWEVVVKLDPAILPQTQLHLVLSDGTLSLRFECRDARARQLICDNGDALRSRLEARLGARIVVHVEVN